jgi:uncharacterized membrane protein YdbT with pleckstrin-like domain
MLTAFYDQFLLDFPYLFLEFVYEFRSLIVYCAILLFMLIVYLFYNNLTVYNHYTFHQLAF